MTTNLPANTMANVPAHIAARIAARQQAGTNKSAVAQAVLGDNAFNFPRISIRAGRYRLVEDGVETPVGISLDVVIVGANPRVSKLFFDKAYDQNATDARPACFSNDGLKPDATVTNPVHPNCTDCPNNVLGSKILPSGAKSKLCADQRHLAVVPAADPNKVYALTVPVSGMTALRDYFKELNNYGVNPEEAITELGFDEQASFPKITFKHKGYVPEKALGRVEELTTSDDVKIAVRMMAPNGATALPAPATPRAELPPAAAEEKPASAPQQMELPLDTPPAAAEKPAAPKATKAKAPAPSSAEGDNPAAELEKKLDSLFG